MLLRDAVERDQEALVAALLQAVNWNGQSRVDRAQMFADPHLSHYVAGWPRAGDFGAVAVDDDDTVIGCGWCRVFDPCDPGYGYVAAEIPELTIGVRQEDRGRGVGTVLLATLIAQAGARGHHALSLSVEDGNRARRLYQRAGFDVVGRNGDSEVMLLNLSPPPAPSQPPA
jgi:ribosomal protein S18 acetylase RimI-like enzyme